MQQENNVVPMRNGLVEAKHSNHFSIEFFDFKGTNIRVIEKDGEPWFFGKEICDLLEIGHTATAYSRLDEDEKSNVVLNNVQGTPINYTIINESGLYSLIMGSRKSEAKPFRKWVTSEVLPSIRKTGSYSVPQSQPQMDINQITIAITSTVLPIVSDLIKQTIAPIQSQIEVLSKNMMWMQTTLTRYIDMDVTNRLTIDHNNKKIIDLTTKLAEDNQSGYVTLYDYMKSHKYSFKQGNILAHVGNFITEEMLSNGYGEPHKHPKTRTRMFPIKLLSEFFKTNQNLIKT
jgi:prophage antirepressor-like protein